MFNMAETVSKDIDVDKKANQSLELNNTDINADSSKENIESKFDSSINDIDIDKFADMSIDSNNLDSEINKSEENKEIRYDDAINDIDTDKFADMSLDSNLIEGNENNTYYDDNGVLYRNGDDLLSNNSYEINGYTYETDDRGRIVSAEGNLKVKDDRPRMKIKDSMDAIGKGDQLDTDDRGHLIADQLNGSNGMENIVPQDSHLNKGEYKSLENQLATEVKNGKDVYYKVEPYYNGDSRRPDYFTVTYNIDGIENMRIFENKIGE